jgi:hypothetical protein
MPQQATDPADQLRVAPAVGGSQARLHGIAGLTRKMYSEIHGCILLVVGLIAEPLEIHPFFIFCQPLFSNSLSVNGVETPAFRQAVFKTALDFS